MCSSIHLKNLQLAKSLMAQLLLSSFSNISVQISNPTSLNYRLPPPKKKKNLCYNSLKTMPKFYSM